MFCAYDEEKVYLYAYSKDTVAGTDSAMACSSKLTFGYTPLMLYDGRLSCQTQSGKV